ncbi:MAG: hypothetical protein MI923_11220, partial [Phycisphaerales bacterium]|nr:hypothetical protein [Phycisphaerales bacterium]
LVITRAHDNAKQVRCQFFFPPGTAAGFWSVVVTNPDTQSDTLPDALEVIDDCPRGAVGDLYVCNSGRRNILQYNGITGDFVCVFAWERPPEIGLVHYNLTDLAWAPNGNLWAVTGSGIPSGPDAVIEFDGETGAYLGYVVPPNTSELQDPTLVLQSLSSGGPNGILCLTEVKAENNKIHGLDPVTFDLEVVIPDASPPMRSPRFGRFTSNGKYLLLGAAQLSEVPTFREYDPNTVPFQLLQNNLVETAARKVGVIETPDGFSYLLSDIDFTRNRVEKYEIATGNVSVVIPRSSCLDSFDQSTCTADPCYWGGFVNSPNDLAYGPNGNLYVCSFSTPVATNVVWAEHGPCAFDMGAVFEIDPNTYEQIRIIGLSGTQVWPSVGDREHLHGPSAIEFKPLPGDWGNSGAAFQGDWMVNENDLNRFVAAVDGTAENHTHAANLLSFDLDRDGVVACADWPAFAAAFEASSGFVPEPPLPELQVFINALLGDEGAACFSDCNDDDVVDGRDIGPYVQAFVN